MNKSLFSLLSLGLLLAPNLHTQADPTSVGGPLRPGKARPPLHLNGRTSTAVVYAPAQIRHVYGYDQLSANGAGQTIAIVDAYGNQNIQNDLQTFCTRFGLGNAPTVQVLGNNTGGNGNGWDLETSLDVEWAHVVAPGATIMLSVAPSASIGDLVNAVQAAVNAGATVVSMSWGGSEFSGERAYDSLFQTAGVTFVASAGDSGELRNGVEWPAASPYVVSVGGTTLKLTSGNTRQSETAWSGSGGGISLYETRPTWQNGWSATTGRGVPDVSYVADPNTGLYVYCSTYSTSGTGWYAVGGTSVGAPQWAATIALANTLRPLGGSLSLADAAIYGVAGTPNTINPLNLFDVTAGSNGRDTDDYARAGYDLVTGLGSPVAPGIVPALATK